MNRLRCASGGCWVVWHNAVTGMKDTTPNHAIEQTARKCCLRVPARLRRPAAAHGERWAAWLWE